MCSINFFGLSAMFSKNAKKLMLQKMAFSYLVPMIRKKCCTSLICKFVKI